MRLSPEIRGAFNKLVKKGLGITQITDLFDTTRQTVHRWLNRAKSRTTEDKSTKLDKFINTVRIQRSIVSPLFGSSPSLFKIFRKLAGEAPYPDWSGR